MSPACLQGLAAGGGRAADIRLASLDQRARGTWRDPGPLSRTGRQPSHDEARRMLDDQLGGLGAGDSWNISDGPCS